MISPQMVLRFLQEFTDDDHHDHDNDHGHDDHDVEIMMEGDTLDHDEFALMSSTNGDDSDGSKPWRAVFFASLLINLVTLCGVILVAFSVMIPKCRGFFSSAAQQPTEGDKRPAHRPFMLSQLLDRLVIPSFAAGALMATSVFLIIPESIELIGGGHGEEHDHHSESHADEDGHNHLRFLEDQHDIIFDANSTVSDSEHDGSDPHTAVAYKFGIALMAGYLLPFFLGSLFPPPHAPDEQCETCKEHEVIVVRSDAANTVLREAEATENEQKCCDHAEKCAAARDDRITTTASVTTFDSQLELVPPQIQDAALSDDEGDTEDANIVPPAVQGDEGDIEEENVAPGEEHCCEDTECKANKSEASNPQSLKRSYNYQLIGSILLGDAFHNFTDGIFVGNAFLFCEHHVAYAIVAATIYHEIAQEFADFCLLTHHCGLNIVPALALNFASGFSVLIGAFLVLSLDFSNEVMGITLAVSAGVYMYIAGSECLPRVMGHQEKQNVQESNDFFVVLFCGSCPYRPGADQPQPWLFVNTKQKQRKLYLLFGKVSEV